MSTMTKEDQMYGSILTVKDQLASMLHIAAVVDHRAEIADIETLSERDLQVEIRTQSEGDRTVGTEIIEEEDHQVEIETMIKEGLQAKTAPDAGMRITAATTTEKATIAAETLLDPHRIKNPEQSLATTMINIPPKTYRIKFETLKILTYIKDHCFLLL